MVAAEPDLEALLLQSCSWHQHHAPFSNSQKMGGGQRYPYPKEVWTPTGGWWTQPKNWRTNTAVTAVGLGMVIYATFMYSAKHEQRHRKVDTWIPSLHWAEQLKGPEYDYLRNSTPKPEKDAQ